jgi:hypothetical protein
MQHLFTQGVHPVAKTTQKDKDLKPLPAQLDKFVQSSLQLDERTLDEKKKARGYMSRALIHATLPHSDPGAVPLWGRRSGQISLSIQPGAYFDKYGKVVQVGLPFGSFPRIVLAMLTSEAVRTKSRRIYLGDSVTEFFKRLEGAERVTLRGGARGELARFREQMKRLLSARIAVTYDDENRGFGFDFLQLADKGLLLWDSKNPEQRALFQSYIELTERFYQECVKNPVPTDMDALRVLRRSPMAIDIFHMLTYRFSYLSEETVIPWLALQVQFGADYTRPRDFRVNFKKQLARVKLVYQTAKVELVDGGLKLQPSPTFVQKAFRKAIAAPK